MGTVVFNENWEIIGIDLVPQNLLGSDPSADYESKVSYRVPFEGLWFVSGEAALSSRTITWLPVISAMPSTC